MTWAKAVQDKNIGKLSTELGFDGQLQGRTYKVLKKELDEVSLGVLLHSSPKVFLRGDSHEAQTLAVQFCQENRRGERLWPETAWEACPTWSKDRNKSVLSRITNRNDA